MKGRNTMNNKYQQLVYAQGIIFAAALNEKNKEDREILKQIHDHLGKLIIKNQ
jgi:hypothetical protein